MANSTVERDAMHRAVGQIDEKIRSITRAQKTLHGQITGLVGSGWVGNAAQAFLHSYENFDEQFAIVIRELDGIHNKLKSSLMHYGHTEEEQTQIASRIDRGLNFS